MKIFSRSNWNSQMSNSSWVILLFFSWIHVWFCNYLLYSSLGRTCCCLVAEKYVLICNTLLNWYGVWHPKYCSKYYRAYHSYPRKIFETYVTQRISFQRRKLDMHIVLCILHNYLTLINQNSYHHELFKAISDSIIVSYISI